MIKNGPNSDPAYYNIVNIEISYGTLAKDMDFENGLIYRRPFSFAKSVDTDQITSSGSVGIKSANMTDYKGIVKNRYKLLGAGDKLVVILTNGLVIGYKLKTAWRW